jgi:hypothetical protein
VSADRKANAQGADKALIGRVETALKLETERPIAVREAIMACKAAGTVS